MCHFLPILYYLDPATNNVPGPELVAQLIRQLLDAEVVVNGLFRYIPVRDMCDPPFVFKVNEVLQGQSAKSTFIHGLKGKIKLDQEILHCRFFILITK